MGPGYRLASIRPSCDETSSAIFFREKLIVAGRREHPDKWTPLTSKIDDVRCGYQIVSAATTSQALMTGVKSKTGSTESHLDPRYAILRMGEATTRNPHHPYFSAFPLSGDHLIPLTHYNVWRALVTNMIIMGQQKVFSCKGDVEHCLRIVPLPLPSAIPQSLQPTQLQCEVEHAPWIDFFPLPALRDTLIIANDTFDSCDLCLDTVGGIIEKNDANVVMGWDKNLRQQCMTKSVRSSSIDENKGLIVWGDPVNVHSWEVSEGFAKKWGWMLREGCEELLRATDSHRQKRMEEPIQWSSLGITCAN